MPPPSPAIARPTPGAFFRKDLLYYGSALLLGIIWYYALYFSQPTLFSHQVPKGLDAPDYYLGLYDWEFLGLMCITGVICGLLFRKRLNRARSKDWLLLTLTITGTGVLIFSVSAVLYAMSLQLMGIGRPDDLQLYHPNLFPPSTGPSFIISYIVLILTAPFAGFWFSVLSFMAVVPMALLTQWVLRRLARTN